LAPKPPKPGEQEEIKTKQLGNQQGRARFNSSTGFDSAPQLAELASRVPIPFGRYEEYALDDPQVDEDEVGITGYPSGGFIVEPLLVWSRLLSNGSFQSLKCIAVIGQTELQTPPDPDGILIGGQPINNFYKSNYAVFFSSRPGDNRLLPSDLIDGDASPAGNWGVPTATGILRPGFSAAYSPSNSTDFGVYNTIPNGNHWRVNWKVVSIPSRSGPDDPGGRKGAEIKKIAGDRAGTTMEGTGRWYTTFCGLTALNGTTYDDPYLVSVNRGDELTYTLISTQINGDDIGLDTEDTGVSGDDVNNTMNSIRERADSLLQLNEVFLINRTLVRVKTRPNTIFDPITPTDMSYDLEVIGFTGSNREIGITGRKSINQPVVYDGGTGTYSDNGDEYPISFSTSWYPLHKCDIGQVSNTRRTEVTELGIRSQVWGQAQGLCNFNAVPSPERLGDYNEDQYEITAGSMTKYLYRSSFFVLGVRPVNGAVGVNNQGTDQSDDDELFDGFDIINGVLFVVRGNTPVNQYNYIRVYHPQKEQYEFRLIPKDACNVHRYDSYEGQAVYVLDVTGPLRSYSETLSHYGTFRLEFNALNIGLSNLFEIPELITDPRKLPAQFDCTFQQLALNGIANADGIVGAQGGGYTQGYFEQILGQLKDPENPGFGDKHVFGYTETEAFEFTDKEITFYCEMTGTVMDNQQDQAFIDRNGTAKSWGMVSVRVTATDGEPQNGETYLDARQLNTGWYPAQFGLDGETAYYQYRADSLCLETRPEQDEEERNFEFYSQIKEMSVWQEKTTSCEQGPEHTIVYINESQDNFELANYNDLSLLGIKLRTLNQVATFQQPQVYMKNGISVNRLIEDDYGPSNNFADALYWMLTRQGASIGQEISPKLVDKAAFTNCARFLETTRLRFDGAIQDQVNLRSFATQLAPLYLCNFVIKNGKFALVPAVPTDSAGLMQLKPTITNIFTAGNIIDGSFELNYVDQSDRQDFRSVIEYRELPVNGLVEKRTILVKWKDEPGTPPAQESIDASQFVTRRGHAFMAARYLLSVRRRIDHIIQFKTLPQGIGIAPGDYIKVSTPMSPIEQVRNIVVKNDLTALSAFDFEDGTYEAGVYRQGADGAVTEEVEIKDGKVVDVTLAGALMNVPAIARRSGVYQVQKVSLEEDGLVAIDASHFPVFADDAGDDEDGLDISGASKIVYDLLHKNRYRLFDVIE